MSTNFCVWYLKRVMLYESPFEKLIAFTEICIFIGPMEEFEEISNFSEFFLLKCLFKMNFNTKIDRNLDEVCHC